LRPILAAYFSEPFLRSLGWAIPFQAEYEGSIPFTRSKLFNRLAVCLGGRSTCERSCPYLDRRIVQLGLA
jgi:hypothetical protein